MEKLHFIWVHDKGGNVDHIQEHDVTIAEVEWVAQRPHAEGVSRTSVRPMRVGFTKASRRLIVVFEWIDPVTIYPITAYEQE